MDVDAGLEEDCIVKVELELELEKQTLTKNTYSASSGPLLTAYDDGQAYR